MEVSMMKLLILCVVAKHASKQRAEGKRESTLFRRKPGLLEQ
jgi:hypothetical protein